MRKLIFIPICLVALLIPVAVLAGSGERGFNGVVNCIEAQYHAKATRIPMMGLISFIARAASRDGVRNMHVAEFEDFSADVDGNELNRMVEEKLGHGWERVVRETSNHGGSQTLIFMRPEGVRMGMFVLDADGHELDVVQISVDADHLSQQIAHYDHHSRFRNEKSD